MEMMAAPFFVEEGAGDFVAGELDDLLDLPDSLWEVDGAGGGAPPEGNNMVAAGVAAAGVAVAGDSMEASEDEDEDEDYVDEEEDKDDKPEGKRRKVARTHTRGAKAFTARAGSVATGVASASVAAQPAPGGRERARQSTAAAAAAGTAQRHGKVRGGCCTVLIDGMLLLAESVGCKLTLDETKRNKASRERLLGGSKAPAKDAAEAGKTRVWNYARLNHFLAQHAFDVKGNYRVHAHCLQSAFDVSNWWINSLHRAVIKQRSTPTENRKAKAVRAGGDAFLSRVVVPAGVAMNTKAWLKSLGDNEEVTLVKTTQHGLAGKESNRGKMLVPAKKRFITFVNDHRSSTNRTSVSVCLCLSLSVSVSHTSFSSLFISHLN